jgi:hypothetical protein
MGSVRLRKSAGGLSLAGSSINSSCQCRSALLQYAKPEAGKPNTKSMRYQNFKNHQKISCFDQVVSC